MLNFFGRKFSFVKIPEIFATESDDMHALPFKFSWHIFFRITFLTYLLWCRKKYSWYMYHRFGDWNILDIFSYLFAEPIIYILYCAAWIILEIFSVVFPEPFLTYILYSSLNHSWNCLKISHRFSLVLSELNYSFIPYSFSFTYLKPFSWQTVFYFIVVLTKQFLKWLFFCLLTHSLLLFPQKNIPGIFSLKVKHFLTFFLFCKLNYSWHFFSFVGWTILDIFSLL